MTSVPLEITIPCANVFRNIGDTAQPKNLQQKNTPVMLVIIYMSKLD